MRSTRYRREGKRQEREKNWEIVLAGLGDIVTVGCLDLHLSESTDPDQEQEQEEPRDILSDDIGSSTAMIPVYIWPEYAKAIEE